MNPTFLVESCPPPAISSLRLAPNRTDAFEAVHGDEAKAWADAYVIGFSAYLRGVPKMWVPQIVQFHGIFPSLLTYGVSINGGSPHNIPIWIPDDILAIPDVLPILSSPTNPIGIDAMHLFLGVSR